ncbi:hypothetical protein V8E52_004358 [Russula decolorans]
MSDPNTSSSTPIFMTRIQIQVGCYRLEILVSVADVGGEMRPLTATGNEEGTDPTPIPSDVEP